MTINTFYDEGGAMTKSRGLPQNHPRSIRTLLPGLRGYYRTEVHIALRKNKDSGDIFGAAKSVDNISSPTSITNIDDSAFYNFE